MNDRGIIHHAGDAHCLGLAWSERLPPGHHTMLVGHRAPYGSLVLAGGFARGLCAGGVDVVDVGHVAPDHMTWLSATLEAPAVLVGVEPGGRNGYWPMRAGAWGLPVADGQALLRRAAQVAAGAPVRRPVREGQVVGDDTAGDYAAFLRAQADVGWLRPLAVRLDAPQECRRLVWTTLDLPDVTLLQPGADQPADLTLVLDDEDLQVADETGRPVPVREVARLLGTVPDGARPWRQQVLWGASSPLLAALQLLAVVGHADVPLSELVHRPGSLRLEVADAARALQAVSHGFGRHAIVMEQSRAGSAPAVEFGLVLRGDAGRRGPWSVEVRPEPGGSRLEVLVEARDEAVMAAVREDVRAIIESAA